MDILDRVLKLFGLITIKRAKTITVEIVAVRERMIVEDVQADFKAPPKSGFEEYIRNWANESFDVAADAITKKKDRLVSDTEYRALLQ